MQIPWFLAGLISVSITTDRNAIGTDQHQLLAVRAQDLRGEHVLNGSGHHLSGAQLEEIHSAIRAELKNPEAARFGHIASAPTILPTVFTVCGWVDAKRSSGDAASQPFIGFSKGPFVMKVGDTRTQHLVVIEFCRDGGVDLERLREQY